MIEIEVTNAKFVQSRHVYIFTINVDIAKRSKCATISGYVEHGNKHIRIETVSPTQPLDLAMIAIVLAEREQRIIESIIKAEAEV